MFVLHLYTNKLICIINDKAQITWNICPIFIRKWPWVFWNVLSWKSVLNMLSETEITSVFTNFLLGNRVLPGIIPFLLLLCPWCVYASTSSYINIGKVWFGLGSSYFKILFYGICVCFSVFHHVDPSCIGFLLISWDQILLFAAKPSVFFIRLWIVHIYL